MLAFPAFCIKRTRGGGNIPSSWIQRTSNFGNCSCAGVAYGSDGYWVVGGGYNLGYRFSTQTDPTGTWTLNSVDTGYGDAGIDHDGTYWCSSGKDNDIYTATDPTGAWTDRRTCSSYDVHYANGIWVSVGGGGEILTATNPTGTWTSRTSGTANALRSAYYGNGVWVAVGDSGTLLTATDPTGTWTTRTSSFSTTSIYDVAYGDGVWTAVGLSGKIATATDPTGTWTQRTSGFGTAHVKGVGFGNGAWCIVGGSGTMATATDPTGTWASQTSSFGSDNINKVAYSSGYWVAVGGAGKIATSSVDLPTEPDSFTLNTSHTFGTSAAYIRAVSYGSDGYWLMAGANDAGNGCVNYINGAPTGSWSEPTHGFGALDCRCLTYDGTNWCVGGYSQSFRYKASPPSGTWSSGTYVPGSTSIYGLDYGSGNWCVSCSGGHIYYKSSSVSGAWSTATETISGDIRAMSYGSDTYWVTGGSNNNIANSSGTPSTFTSRTTPFGGTDEILGADYDGSTNWVVGSSDGDIAYSSDHGVTWTIVSNPGPFVNGEWINDVQYGNGVWAICGSNGKIATATDPTSAGNWELQNSGFGTTFIRCINYGNGYWVAAGSSGKVSYCQVKT